MTTVQVLVVDDSPELLELISVLLEHTGHTAVTATTPHDALAAAASQPFALLISDLEMPGMDGLELLRQIRQLPGHAALPVLLISGHPLDRLPAQDGLYRLEKPFSIIQFEQCLQAALAPATA